MNIVNRIKIDQRIIEIVNQKYFYNKLSYFLNSDLDGYVIERSGVRNHVEAYKMKPYKYIQVLTKDINPSQYSIYKCSSDALDFPVFYNEKDVQKAINNLASYLYKRDFMKEEIE